MVSCANRCPRRCSDLQEGLACQVDQACQPGCRCSDGKGGPVPRCGRKAGGTRVPAQLWRAASPTGFLEQDGGCVPIGHCECTDAQGHSWAPGSRHQEACGTCTCHAGRLSCAAQPCPPPAHCSWSRWSAWSPCSRSCGPEGQQSRFRYGPGLGQRHPPAAPVSHCLDSVSLSDAELPDPAPRGHTLCARAPAFVPGHPCFL